MTSYEPMNIADVDRVYGLQLTHPRFLEFLGPPELTRLLNGLPGHWVRTMDCEDTVAAALQLQHDAGVMTLNLQVLDQFVTLRNCVSSEILRLAVRPVVFPSAIMDVFSPVPRAPRPTHYMSAMGLWRPPDGPGVPGPRLVSSCNRCMKCTHCFLDPP